MSLVAKRFDDAKAGEADPAVQIAPRRHRRRRAEARLHLCRRRGRGGALAAGDAGGIGHLQCRHRQGAELPRSDAGAVRRRSAASRTIEYVDMPAVDPRHLSVFHASRDRQSAPRRLYCRLHDARRRREALRDVLSRSRRPVSVNGPRGRAHSMFDFEEALRLVAKQTVLCIGDVMLDDFVYGEVTRISPEAPTPVLAVTPQRYRDRRRRQRRAQHRGAWRALHFRRPDRRRRCRLRRCATRSAKLGVDRPRTGGRQGAADHAQGALRLRTSLGPSDAGRLGNGGAGERRRARRRSSPRPKRRWPRPAPWCCRTMPRACSPPRVIRAVIDAARRLGKPVIVDPKGHDYRVYRGATLITPNAKELAAAVHRPVTTDAEIAAAAAELAHIVGSEAVLVTRSEDGMTPARRGRRRRSIFRPIRSRCATCPAPATRSPP